MTQFQDVGYVLAQVQGPDEDGEYYEDVGAPRRRVVRRPSGRVNVSQGIPNRTALALPSGQARPFASAIPGVPTPGRRTKPMGFGAVIFSLGSGTRLSMSRVIQKPFAPTRLFLSERRLGSTGGLVTVESFKIGSDEQLINGGVPVEMFFGNVFGIGVELDEASAGLTITLDFQISSAPTTTDTVTVAGALHGVTMA